MDSFTVWEEDNKVLIECNDVSSDTIIVLTKDETTKLIMQLREFVECDCH